jgi:hypothetical protein
LRCLSNQEHNYNADDDLRDDYHQQKNSARKNRVNNLQLFESGAEMQEIRERSISPVPMNIAKMNLLKL